MSSIENVSAFRSIDASSSGLTAERVRMDVIANNIANANVTRGPDGQPFRRREVVFSTAMDDAEQSLAGVRVESVQPDNSELTRVYKPGHPHADVEGYVTMPNVVVSSEMVDLMVASRAYEANLNAIRVLRDMTENTLDLLR